MSNTSGMTDIHRLSENLASEDEASVSNSPQAVRIVEVVEETDHSFELAISELEKILLQPDIADKKVAVIGVAGAYRKGKSFLLNFFLRYLQWRSDHPEAADDLDGSEWMDSSSALKGFSWRGGSERDTNGILIWSKPFILKDKNSEDVVVILMDTQGAFDSQSTVKDCATIFALSTMISSIQIYNLSQNIQEDDLQHLQLFTEYGRLALEGSSSKPFQSLMFLVRDWSFPYENEFGFQGGQRLLDTRLKVSEKQHEELQSLRKHIRECFDDISCFLMPHPGLEVACNPAFDGKLTEIRDEFQQQLRVLVPRLMDPNHLVVKEINGHKITCREIVEYFKAYMKIFQGQELPEPKSMLTATAEANNLAAVACARAIYQKRMEEVCGGDTPYMNSNQLNEEHERAKNEAIREFRNARKMGGEEFSMKYMDGLVEDIEHNKESFVQVNNAKNLFKSMRTPACLVLLMIINYIGQEFFQLLGIDAIAGVFTSLLFLIITALGIWTYSRYSGNLRDAGGWIDEAVSYVWINFVSPNTRHMGAMGGALDLYDQFSGNNSTKADSFRANEERKHQ